MFYAAITKPNTAGGCPPGCCWLSQIQIPLDWIQAFLNEHVGDLIRVFSLDAYLRRGPPVVITTDASPYGLGAILEIGGTLTSFFSDVLSDQDRLVLNTAPDPNCSYQQVLEALAVLVALRHWHTQWRGRRVQLELKTDNVAALTLVTKMQPHSQRLGLIAREMALDIAASAYTPDSASHIPGIANKAADALSRQASPSPPPLPSYLSESIRTKVETRGNRGGWPG